jgi:hypothetical protein
MIETMTIQISNIAVVKKTVIQLVDLKNQTQVITF